jgi:hypothetical protein
VILEENTGARLLEALLDSRAESLAVLAGYKSILLEVRDGFEEKYQN